RALRALAVVGFAAMSGACSGAATESDQERTPITPNPECEGRGERIVRGLTKTSDDGALAVSLVAGEPLPPVQGPNSWTLDVSLSGEPVLDAGDADAQVIANVYMAEHDHNIRKRGTMTEPGVFEFAQFPITMNGYWEVTVQVLTDPNPDEEGAQPETVADAVFGFCVES
ncbi:MAG TPA: FixH family protein, partial [Polyangiaceae bacterium]